MANAEFSHEPSRKLEEGNGSIRLSHCLEHPLNPSNGLRGKQHITAHAANVGGDVINDHHFATIPHRMRDRALFVITRTICQGAFHLAPLLSEGVFHFGSLGS
jgi:hypothetical protein